jgi:hypothetical protein
MIRPKYQDAPKPTRAQEQDAYELVGLRDGNTCQRCRRDCGPIARDHRKNRSQGGLTVPDNLQLLGLGCHQWKTEHPEQAITDGWGVPGWPTAVPAEWPARRWVRTHVGARRLAWVTYDDYGGVTEITEKEARERMTAMGWAS